MTTANHNLTKIAGMKLPDFYSFDGVKSVDKQFVAWLQKQQPTLAKAMFEYRQGQELEAKALSSLLLAISEQLERFIAQLFEITAQVQTKQQQAMATLPLFIFKKEWLHKVVKRRLKEFTDDLLDFGACLKQLLQLLDELAIEQDADLELRVAVLAKLCLDDADQYETAYEILLKWCVAAQKTPLGQVFVADWISFRTPDKVDFNELVECESIAFFGTSAYVAPESSLRQRQGFSLTDHGLHPLPVMNQAQYCVYCHQTGTDFCSKGFLVKKNDPAKGYKENPLGELLLGCPLDEKISEMNWLYHAGLIIAPLVMVMLDNPMCPATGYRICNDCMKSCIYQKQEPVNIPAIETEVLKRVLALPWGAEIYQLLTRWSPLAREPDVTPKVYNGINVCVMGMGPAGFTLAHYLLRNGYAVAGMDGLKIEHLAKEVIHNPIQDFSSIHEDLDERCVLGFGGVAEYGITSRWDKNFLLLIYISLMRQAHFQLFGSVRFGGTLTMDRAWELGFDHLAIAVGAGLPKELSIENSMVNGMRQANDFLMTLQLTGAGKFDSLANCQIRLPAVVIGGGLTGVDTATEVAAYYIRQIEKISYRYSVLCKDGSMKKVRANINEHDLIILDEFLDHAAQWQEEKELAQKENRQSNVVAYLRRWGGVSIAYRKAMQLSPAYRLNSEELNKAMQEGIYYVPHVNPTKVICDHYGDASALECFSTQDDKYIVLPARSIFVATGAKPNVAYAFEHRHDLKRDGFEYERYQDIDSILERMLERNNCKTKDVAMFTSYDKHNKRVTFLGDTHPTFHGSVVKAIASGGRCFNEIDQLMQENISINKQLKFADLEKEYQKFASNLEKSFFAKVIAVNSIHKDVVEIVVDAPSAAKMYKPGVIYKLQTYDRFEANNQDKLGLGQSSESVALTAIKLKDKQDQLRFLVKTIGVSSKMLALTQVGDPIVVMGPTGVAAKIPEKKTVIFIGGYLALAGLRAAKDALLDNQCQVAFFGCYQHKEDVIDQPHWLEGCHWVETSIESNIADHRVTLINFINTIVNTIADKKVAEIRVIGSVPLLCWMKQLRQTDLKIAALEKAKWFASVFGPMQCMLKGVCAQCLQWQVDPATGKRTKAVVCMFVARSAF